MVTLTAVSVPVVGGVPAAVTHEPDRERHRASPRPVWVTVVAVLTVTFTFLVVVVGLAFFFAGAMKVVAFTVT